MANKRQRLARHRFSQSTGAIPQLSNDHKKLEKKAQTNQKKRKQDHMKLEKKALINHKKRKRVQQAQNGGLGDSAEDHIVKKKLKQELGFVEGRSGQTAKGKKGSKHPLRIAGKKPGEGCFICKAVDHIAKWCPRKQEKDRKKVCLFCREVGHTLKNCPKKQDAQEVKICYNCGGVGHHLTECMETIKGGGTSFADCFVCKQKGHLSKNCPSNTNGIYPKGGSCKVCGSITHLAKDCPEKGTGKPTYNGSGQVKLQISKNAAPAFPPGGNSKQIVFGSGDDLEDDFIDAGNDQGIGSGSETYKESSHVSRKKLKQKDGQKKIGQVELSLLEPIVKRVGKRTPKVVNFFK